MASLSELLSKKKVTSGGQLFQTSQEELSNLAKKSGMAAPPTSPAGAQMLGATPDQAKMAGSAQQKQAAIRQSIQESDAYQTQQRQQQARKEQTEQERQEQERAQRLSGLGDLQGRVQELASKMLGGAGETAQQLNIEDTKLAEAGVTEESKPRFKELLGKLSQGTATLDDVKEMNVALGRGVTNTLTPEQLKEMFGGVSTQVGGVVTGAVADQIKVSDLNQDQLGQLGFTNLEELAQSIGVEPSELGNTTVQQLQDKIQQIRSSEYSKVQNLQQQASDPNLGAAERAEARKLLRESGAVGTRAAEEDVTDLAQQIESADQVKFGGKEYSVQQLLSDSTLSGFVDQYFNDEDYRKKLQETEPQFADWLNQNESAVKKMLSQVDPKVREFNDIQAQRASLAKTPNGSTLPDSVMKMVFPDWGSLGTSKYDVSQTPEAFKLLQSENVDPRVRANIESFLSEASDQYPDMANQLLGLNRQELASIGVFDQGSSELQNFLNYRKQKDTAQNAQTTEEFLTGVFGMNLPEAQQLIQQANGLRILGMPVNYLQKLDSDGDGKVDDLSLLKRNLTGSGEVLNSVNNLKDLVNSGRRPSSLVTGSDITSSLKDRLNSANPELSKVAKYIGDGNVSALDALVIGNELSLATLDKLISGKKINWGGNQDVVQSKLNAKVENKVKEVMGDTPQHLYETADKATNINLMRDIIGKLDKQLSEYNTPTLKQALENRKSAYQSEITKYENEIKAQQQKENDERQKLINRMQWYKQ